MMVMAAALGWLAHSLVLVFADEHDVGLWLSEHAPFEFDDLSLSSHDVYNNLTSAGLEL